MAVTSGLLSRLLHNGYASSLCHVRASVIVPVIWDSPLTTGSLQVLLHVFSSLLYCSCLCMQPIYIYTHFMRGISVYNVKFLFISESTWGDPPITGNKYDSNEI